MIDLYIIARRKFVLLNLKYSIFSIRVESNKQGWIYIRASIGSSSKASRLEGPPSSKKTFYSTRWGGGGGRTYVMKGPKFY